MLADWFKSQSAEGSGAAAKASPKGESRSTPLEHWSDRSRPQSKPSTFPENLAPPNHLHDRAHGEGASNAPRMKADMPRSSQAVTRDISQTLDQHRHHSRVQVGVEIIESGNTNRTPVEPFEGRATTFTMSKGQANPGSDSGIQHSAHWLTAQTSVQDSTLQPFQGVEGRQPENLVASLSFLPVIRASEAQQQASPADMDQVPSGPFPLQALETSSESATEAASSVPGIAGQRCDATTAGSPGQALHVHIHPCGDGLKVWLGLNISLLPDLPAIAGYLQAWSVQQGKKLNTVICNGHDVTDQIQSKGINHGHQRRFRELQQLVQQPDVGGLFEGHAHAVDPSEPTQTHGQRGVHGPDRAIHRVETDAGDERQHSDTDQQPVSTSVRGTHWQNR